MTTPRGEFAWIARLADLLGEATPEASATIGDDAATVVGPRGDLWAWTIDALVEGVHFRFDWLDAEAIGHRALAASLSDLAAAGVEPVGALVSAAGPQRTIEDRLEGIYRGIAGLSRHAACPVLGGDLSRAEGPLHLTVAALGRSAGGAPLGRGGARPGDEVWITGALGGPAAALALLAAEGPTLEVRSDPAYARLARPEPRCREVLWLRARAPIRAAIDVSDGLSGDVAHVAARSGVRIAIEAARVPVHPAAREIGRRLEREPFEWALHGGEEFEVLLFAPAEALAPLATPFAEMFGVPLERIGAVTQGRGVELVRDGPPQPLVPLSWDHFPRV